MRSTIGGVCVWRGKRVERASLFGLPIVLIIVIVLVVVLVVVVVVEPEPTLVPTASPFEPLPERVAPASSVTVGR